MTSASVSPRQFSESKKIRVTGTRTRVLQARLRGQAIVLFSYLRSRENSGCPLAPGEGLP